MFPSDTPLIYMVLAVICFTGFTIIFISVAMTPLADESSYLRVQIQTHFDKTNGILEAKNREIESLYRQIKENNNDVKPSSDVASSDNNNNINNANALALSLRGNSNSNSNGNSENIHLYKPSTRPGVIILGMHRSGTSVLGGLVNMAMGLKTGGPLIAPGEDNKKGFFERIDVVLQNDYIMRKQQVHYAGGTHRYDALKGLTDVLAERKLQGSTFFKEGERGLAFLNDKNSYPWMLKDPRLCITFRTWLPLLNFVPAILFTYRHPLDVALSMNKRETEHFPIQKGLKLWYVYNMRSVVQSNDLCRVVTSHRRIMEHPKEELDRLYTELRDNCGVMVPSKASEEVIKDFVDVKLQHGQTSLKDKSCENDADLATAMPPDTWKTNDPNHISLYRECMRVYCAMEEGSAFEDSFNWQTDMKDN